MKIEVDTAPRYIQWSAKFTVQLLHSYVVSYFLSPQKIRNTAHSALILFLVNPQDSEAFKMVSFAIVARLDMAHQFASISRNSLKCLQKLNKSTDFREIDAT